MKQPIAGVVPSSEHEVTVMTVWPTLGARTDGRWMGRLFMNEAGFRLFGVPVTVGRILALLSIPFVLPLFFWTLSPFSARRYRLTNRRVLVEKGLVPQEEKSVSLDRFDAIDVEVLPGQEWYPAGDLVFRLGQTETFRLQGVSRPEAFRHVCLKSQQSFVGVQRVLAGA